MRLQKKFKGTFNAETIERYITDSQTRIESRARFANWLPILIERFTHDKGEIRDDVLTGRAWAEFCDALKAASDPGFGNWMSTDGHRFGAVGLRWNQATTDVEPDVRVIAI